MVAKWISREVTYGGAPAVPTSRMHLILSIVLGKCRQRDSNPGPRPQKALQSSALSLSALSLDALCCALRLRMRLSHYTTRPASAPSASPKKILPVSGAWSSIFHLGGRRARRFAPSASPKKILVFEGLRHAILSTSGCGCEAQPAGRGCGCEASRAPKMRMRGLPGRLDAEAG